MNTVILPLVKHMKLIHYSSVILNSSCEEARALRINQPLDNNMIYDLSTRPLSFIETALKR